MATKRNMRNVASRLLEGQIDPHSAIAQEMLDEIAQRVLKADTPAK